MKFISRHVSVYPDIVIFVGLVITVDGSWQISDSFLFTWYNMKEWRIWDKTDVIVHDHVKKISRACLFV